MKIIFLYVCCRVVWGLFPLQCPRSFLPDLILVSVSSILNDPVYFSLLQRLTTAKSLVNNSNNKGCQLHCIFHPIDEECCLFGQLKCWHPSSNFFAIVPNLIFPDVLPIFCYSYLILNCVSQCIFEKISSFPVICNAILNILNTLTAI